MNEKFQRVGFCKNWEVSDGGVTYGGDIYAFDTLKKISPAPIPPTIATNGVATVETKSAKVLNCGYKRADRERAERAIEFLKSKVDALALSSKPGIKYSLDGARGRHMDVYEDRVCITTDVTIGSLIAGNVTDGSKEIYFSDVIGVQAKAPSITLGYIQFETASIMMNNGGDNFFNENTFTYNESDLPNGLADEVVKFVKEKVAELKKTKNSPVVVQASSSADELKKFKELLDMGAITEEEFNAKKKELLGL